MGGNSNMKKLYTIPLIPLRGLTVFPNVVVHFDVGREKSTAAIEQAMLDEQEIFLVGQKNSVVEEPNQDEIYSIGTICKIKQILKMSDNTIRVLVEGQERGKIVKYIEDEEDYIKVSVEKLSNKVVNNEELDAYIKCLDKEFIKLLKLNEENYGEFGKVINYSEKPSDFVDMVASYAITDEKLKQEVLETVDLKKRAEKVLERIKVENSIAKIQRKIANKVKNTVAKEQKDFYLREQIKAIQEELGEDDDEKKEIAKYE